MSAQLQLQPRARLGSPRLHLRLCESTNLVARGLAEAGAGHGTLVTAAEQSAGRGRHARRWWAPAGGALLMSLVLRLDALWGPGAAEERGLLPLAAGVAVCDAIDLDARLKWPNDVVLVGSGGALAKLAGILVEGRPQAGWLVLGIGVNVAFAVEEAPSGLRPALATLGRSPAEIEPLLARLLGALQERLGEPAERTLQAWRSRDALVGREVTWTEGATGESAEVSRHGRAAGIDDLGRLVVEVAEGGSTLLGAGDVHLHAAGRAAGLGSPSS